MNLSQLNKKTLQLLEFYVLWKLEGAQPIRKNSRSLALHGSPYMNGTNCSLLKVEFSFIELDLETERLPKKYYKRAYEELYENMGHLGAESWN